MNYAFRSATMNHDAKIDGSDSWPSLLADIRFRREEFMAQRHTSQDIVDRLKDLGVTAPWLRTNSAATNVIIPIAP